MKHHFADLLDREGDYWTIVPNTNRYAYSAGKELTDKDSVKILTITKYDRCWKQVFDLTNLEELTLHEPSKEQVESLSNLHQLRRLRVTHLRTNSLGFLSDLSNLEELVLEYVSGFSDLSPLRKLRKIKSLHFENLRSVATFDGLKGMDSLKYLHIDGTLDWNQPIQNFQFLKGIENLEVLSLGFVINKSEFPAFLPILKLRNLKKIAIGRATFNTKEYAFLQTALPNVKGCSWDLCWNYNGNYEFLGKQAGRIKCTNPKVEEKCSEFVEKYQELKRQSEQIIKALDLP